MIKLTDVFYCRVMKGIVIGKAEESDFEDLLAFYKSVEYSQPISGTDQLVFAKCEHLIVGVLRIVTEHGHLVLRGMQVEKQYQREGIGTRMLEDLENIIGKREYMKKLIMIVVGGVILVSLSLTAIAQDTDICPCDVDDQTGECLPCPSGE